MLLLLRLLLSPLIPPPLAQKLRLIQLKQQPIKLLQEMLQLEKLTTPFKMMMIKLLKLKLMKPKSKQKQRHLMLEEKPIKNFLKRKRKQRIN